MLRGVGQCRPGGGAGRRLDDLAVQMRVARRQEQPRGDHPVGIEREAEHAMLAAQGVEAGIVRIGHACIRLGDLERRRSERQRAVIDIHL